MTLRAMTLGQRLRYYRDLLQKSQKQVENETGIPQTTLSGWENDGYEPKATELKLLANCYQVSVHKLLGIGEQQTADRNTNVL